MKTSFNILVLFIIIVSIGLLNANSLNDTIMNVETLRSGSVYIEYKIRTDDFYAETKEANLFQGYADPVWQLKCQMGASINNDNWSDWLSVADVPGSSAYNNGAWYNQDTIERWTGLCLSEEDNVYIRIQGFENEGTDPESYVSGTDNFYSYDNYDMHRDLSGSVTRGEWSNFINTETGNGDYADCGSSANNNYYKAELDVWWDYALPLNPEFSLNNITNEAVSVNLTDDNNYRITSWALEASLDSDFTNVVFFDSGITDSSYSISGLNSGTRYWIRIYGTNERGNGSYTASKTIMTYPDPANIIFPAHGAVNLPRLVTVNWQYNGTDSPSFFQVFQNGEQVASDIQWDGDRVYIQRLNISNWGESVNWRVLTFNSQGDCLDVEENIFTVMEEPEDTSSVAQAVVYSQLLDFYGTETPVIVLPSIILAETEVQPTVQIDFETVLSSFSTEIYLYDQTINPLPQPQNCAVAFSIFLPQYRGATITINYQSTDIANEIVHWDGTKWENIGNEANAIFTEGKAVFDWTSWDRGTEFFAINKGTDSTLPVELSSFTAVASSDSFVKVQWTTQTETDLLGFNLLKNTSDSFEEAIRINSNIIYAHNSNMETNYEYLDTELGEEKTYCYWLTSHELNGEINIFGPIRVSLKPNTEEDVSAFTYTTELMNNNPNPFNPSTNINFTLREADDVKFQIYNIKGQLIYDYEKTHFPEGKNSIIWKGVDKKGDNVSSDIYIVKMIVGNQSFSKKIIMLK